MKIQPQHISLFLWQSIFFIGTLVLGVSVALEVQKLLAIEQVAVPQLEPWRFLLIFAVLTAFMIFMARLPRGRGFIFRAFFILAVWWGGALSLSVWIPDTIALLIMTIMVVVWLFWTKVFLHNILVILGIAGVASVFGLRFSPESIVVLLIFFAVYDVIAVYKTKHMVKLAKAMLGFGAIFAVIAPEKFSYLNSRMKDVAPGKKFMMLGGGDIAFPLMLASSMSMSSIINAYIIIGFSSVGTPLDEATLIARRWTERIPDDPQNVANIFHNFAKLLIKNTDDLDTEELEELPFKLGRYRGQWISAMGYLKSAIGLYGSGDMNLHHRAEAEYWSSVAQEKLLGPMAAVPFAEKSLRLWTRQLELDLENESFQEKYKNAQKRFDKLVLDLSFMLHTDNPNYLQAKSMLDSGVMTSLRSIDKIGY